MKSSLSTTRVGNCEVNIKKLKNEFCIDLFHPKECCFVASMSIHAPTKNQLLSLAEAIRSLAWTHY